MDVSCSRHDNIMADVSNSLVSEVYSWHVSIPCQSAEPNSLTNGISFLSEFAHSLRNEIPFLSEFANSLRNEIPFISEFANSLRNVISFLSEFCWSL